MTGISGNINVIVFGGTGHTGPFILERGIKEGLNVTAFVRNPSKIPQKLCRDLRVIKGDILNTSEVVDALEGQDMVLSALGCGMIQSATTLLSDGCRNILTGMKKHNVRKIVIICGASVLPGHWKPWIFRHITDDHQRQISLLRAEGNSIDWVVLAPGFIMPFNAVSKSYKVEKNQLPGRMLVTAGEIADFMMRIAKDEQTSREVNHSVMGISNGPAFLSSTTINILTFFCAVAFITLIACYETSFK